jgi:hypothetical protein
VEPARREPCGLQMTRPPEVKLPTASGAHTTTPGAQMQGVEPKGLMSALLGFWVLVWVPSFLPKPRALPLGTKTLTLCH